MQPVNIGQTDRPGAAQELERIIWHCGFPKTASSSMQVVLRRNRTALAPYFSIFAKARDTAGIRGTAVTSWRKDTDEARAAFRTAVQDIVARAADAGARTALISEENLVGDRFMSDRGSMIDAAREVLPVLAELGAPARSEFVFYTRQIEPWLRSAYNQDVKALRCTLDFDDWLDGIPFQSDFESHCERLREDTGLNITFYSLNDEIAAGEAPGTNLLRHAGLDTETIAALDADIERANESLSPMALEFMLALNRSAVPDRHIRAMRKVVLGNLHVFKSSDGG